ncbi:GNAT family N-acetyltransferase [Actinomycetaceae bacterium L2_0104]
MPANLVRCTEYDVDELAHVSAETFVEAFGDQNSAEDLDAYMRKAFAREKLVDELGNRGSLFFLAYLDGELAGYLKLNLGEAQSEDIGSCALEVERIYTLARFKRRGLGRTMMARAFDEAASRSLNTVWLGVWEHNRAAREFYEHLGFVAFGSHVFTLGSQEQTDLLMRRDTP